MFGNLYNIKHSIAVLFRLHFAFIIACLSFSGREPELDYLPGLTVPSPDANELDLHMKTGLDLEYEKEGEV